MTLFRLMAIGGTAAVLAASGASATNLVLDPGFEGPGPNADGFTQYLGGQQMGPWSVLGNDILLLASEHSEGSGPPVYFNAHSGDAAVDLSGDGNSGPTDGISQTISTTPSMTYDVSFYVGNQNASGSFGYLYTQPSKVDFQVDGGTRTGFTNENTIANGIQWTLFTTTFQATGASTNIAFLNGTPVGDNYAGLDDVSVSPAPEPASWTLMIAGVFGVGLVMRRRTRGLSIEKLASAS